MKKILITGAGSYVGASLEHWLSRGPGQNRVDPHAARAPSTEMKTPSPLEGEGWGGGELLFRVDTVDMTVDSWKARDFSAYDTVIHVAGIAHIRETKANQELYYKVNRDLAHETAQRAKAGGVKQFIFLSSMSVYGLERGVIGPDTPLAPNSAYGRSKLQAEELIKALNGGSFKTAILRPPMVYGKGCKGNYPRLAALAVKVPVFPAVDNKRSMLYIDNLCEFVRLLIDDCAGGLFFPQNSEYVQTSRMVQLIAAAHGKKIRLTRAFNPLLRAALQFGTANKVFGDLVYAMSMSGYSRDYRVCDLETSIFLTERGRTSEQ